MRTILQEIKEKIFTRLDKEGNYRGVDEGSARDIVSSVIDSYIHDFALLEEAKHGQKKFW